MIKVAINGYGRIGRNIVRAIYESNRSDQIRVVAINDIGNAETNVHLTKYDSVHGRFQTAVSLDGNIMKVNGDKIELLTEKDPENLPWERLDIDVVYECSGKFKSRELAGKHIKAGAKKVLISAPGSDVDATVVYGVNDTLEDSQ